MLMRDKKRSKNLDEFESRFGNFRLFRSRRNTRTVTISIVGVFALASLLKFDVYSIAEGQLSPDSYLRSIDAPRTGRVMRVYVNDGDLVQAGQLILEYDCGPQKQQSEAAKAQLADFERELAVQAAVVDAIVPRRAQADSAVATHSPDAALRTSLYRSAKLASDRAIRVAEAQVPAARARLRAADAALQLSQQDFSRVQELSGRGFATRAALDQAMARLHQALSGSALAKSELQEALEAVAQTRAASANSQLEDQNTAVNRAATLRAQAFELRTELAKLNLELADCTIKSPVTGKLFWINTLAQGTLLRQATPLSKVVPQNHPMVVHAQLRNQDIAFVRVGQKAIVKLTSLPYERYGALTGEVTFVAPDSSLNDLGESTYKVEIVITSIPEETRRALPRLISGMDVQINVVTDNRRLISYFFDPIFRAIQDSFHER